MAACFINLNNVERNSHDLSRGFNGAILKLTLCPNMHRTASWPHSHKSPTQVQVRGKRLCSGPVGFFPITPKTSVSLESFISQHPLYNNP